MIDPFMMMQPEDNGGAMLEVVLYNVFKEADDMKYTAEEMFEIVKKEMTNEERIKFLEMMHNEYFNSTGIPSRGSLDY